MKQYLIDKKEDIKNLSVKKREIRFLKTKSIVQAVIGPRRAGKSFSLFYFMKSQKLKDEDFVFVNFEDDEIKKLQEREKKKLVQFHVEIYGKEPKYVFLDEIQNLKNWEPFVYSLYEKKRYCIFMTGSSSKLLSKEIATQLRGRALPRVILPLNFREYLELKRIKLHYPLSTLSISKIKNTLMNFLSHTGFPQVVIDGLNPKVFLKEYTDLVIFRDIVERYKVTNIHSLRFLMTSMLSSISNEFSINKVFNDLKSIGVKIGKGTLYDYTAYLEDVMFSFLVKKFYFSEKKSMLSIPKVYVCDVGLPNYLVSTKISENIGRNMENVVFLELKRREIEGGPSVFYFKDYQQNEVDFVLKEGLEVGRLIQVTYASSRDEIERREVKSLIKASDELKCKDLLVITWDYEGEEIINNKKVKFVPLWKWLLSF